MPTFSRGFRGRRPDAAAAGRLPPGQYETKDFPVLSAGPTPHTPLASWNFTMQGADGKTARWSWEEFTTLPRQATTNDIHCVTGGERYQAITVRDGEKRRRLHHECAAR